MSVCGTVTPELELRRYFLTVGISELVGRKAFFLAHLGSRRRICLSATYVHDHTLGIAPHPERVYTISHPCHAIAFSSGAGIFASFPSATPRGLALGTD